MSGRYLVCVKCVLLNRRNAPNKTTSKKTICKGCVENSFIILFAGTLFIKKKKKCARSESAVCKWCVENSFITICFISWYIIYKKKSMQGLNQQFFVASIHLTSGCYWLWNECWKSVWNECWECAQEVLMRQTFHGDTQLARFIIVNIGKEPHSSYCQKKTSNLAAFFFLRERKRNSINWNS